MVRRAHISWDLRERALPGVGLVEAGDVHPAVHAVGRRARRAAVGVDWLTVGVAGGGGGLLGHDGRGEHGQRGGVHGVAYDDAGGACCSSYRPSVTVNLSICFWRGKHGTYCPKLLH
jgi:hypothetical protein